MKLEDIAKRAQVSKAAVSLALRGKPGISSQTRDRILQIVKESGYIPRSLIKAEQVYGLTSTLRFVACTNAGIVNEHYFNQPFFHELIHYIEEHCRSRGYSLFFSSISIEHFQNELERLETEHESSGIILLGTNLTQEQIENVSKKQPKLVVLDTCFDNSKIDFVVMNNTMGAYQAGRHLIELEHRRIGYVQSVSRMYNFDRRKQGFLSALSEAGLTINDSHYFSIHPTIAAEQEHFLDQIRERNGDLPTALFCECDYMAISVIKSLLRLGIQVPKDISVVGFDNIHESTIISPELTTIHVEKEKMAQLAVTRLLDMIEKQEAVSRKLHIDTRLIVRKSSSSPYQLPES